MTLRAVCAIVAARAGCALLRAICDDNIFFARSRARSYARDIGTDSITIQRSRARVAVVALALALALARRRCSSAATFS